MAVIKVETKNKVDIDKKPRVYFTCHPEDFEKYFKKVCEDIFKTHDCAVYYTEDMTERIAEDEKEVELGRNNLFVIPVTHKLLSTPSRAMDEDFPCAMKEHIPVLPIMMETGIDLAYSEKFGELQYLNPYSRDLTEIAYGEKLKKYLESVLISNETAERIRAAFDAYIFLSYRKKDRKYANELMRLIHSYPECADIAVWFDEFLTPGESFKENIAKILEDCKLFTLLITPRLLEKVTDENGEERDNYVVGVELPAARQKKKEKGTDIIAVEMAKTDKNALHTLEIEDCLNPADEVSRARLVEAISEIAVKENKTAEHHFLIGLAYLEGIDVEVDRKHAVELIISAANKNLPEAISKLVGLYKNGIGLPYDIHNAIMWQNRLISILEQKYKKTKQKDDLIALFYARFECAELYMTVHNYAFAETKIEKILPRLISCKTQKDSIVKRDPRIVNCILYSYLLLSDIYLKMGEVSKSICSLERAQSFYSDMMMPTEGEDKAAVESIIANHIAIYLQLAKQYKELYNYKESLEYAKKAIRLFDLYLPQTSCFCNPRQMGSAYELAGDACFYDGDFENAAVYYEKMYDTIRAYAADSEDPLYQRDLAYSCNRMGEITMKNGKLKDAKAYFMRSFSLSSKIERRDDEDDGNMAFCYNRFGDLYGFQKRHLLRVLNYKKANRIRVGIYEKHQDLDSAMHLAYSYVNLGRVSLFRQKYYFSKAKPLFEFLIEKSPTPEYYEKLMHDLLGL